MTLAGAQGRPNILFIMSDDHAAHAISAYGSRVNQTPNLDRLANAGMRFENCFCVNSICSPSRATILTGKYSHLNGVPTFNRFDGSQPTVAKYLQAKGYYTGMIGKWHLVSDPTGFDEWTILPGQGCTFIDDGKDRYLIDGDFPAGTELQVNGILAGSRIIPEQVVPVEISATDLLARIHKLAEGPGP